MTRYNEANPEKTRKHETQKHETCGIAPDNSLAPEYLGVTLDHTCSFEKHWTLLYNYSE